jgi:hypothetical protein
MPHSCGQYSVDDFLKGKSPQAVALYTHFVELVQGCGPVIIAPAKTRIGFQVRMIFAAVNKLTDQHMDVHIVLARQLENPRFRRIESLTPTSHVHHFRITALDQLDEEVLSWLKEAYAVGEQKHLR